MHLPSRRGVLRVGIIGAGVVAVRGRVDYPEAAQVGVTLPRHDVASPEGQKMLQIFAEGVGKMMAMPPGDPRGWLFQWHIHAVPDDRSKMSELARLFIQMRPIPTAPWRKRLGTRAKPISIHCG